jgi:hypothetical protein
MSLILVFNKNSPWAHMESELGVLGVHGKLVKYVVHSSKKNYFSSHKLPKQQSTSFWSQGILGVNLPKNIYYSHSNDLKMTILYMCFFISFSCMRANAWLSGPKAAKQTP